MPLRCRGNGSEDMNEVGVQVTANNLGRSMLLALRSSSANALIGTLPGRRYLPLSGGESHVPRLILGEHYNFQHSKSWQVFLFYYKTQLLRRSLLFA